MDIIYIMYNIIWVYPWMLHLCPVKFPSAFSTSVEGGEMVKVSEHIQ